MRTALRNSLFLLMAQWVVSTCAVAQELVITSERGSDGRTREYRVSKSALESTSDWSPLEEDPPVSIRQAVTITTEKVKPSAPEVLEIVGLELASFLTDRGQRWFYIVTLYDSEQAYSDEPPDIQRFIVLMDGTFVEGTIVE